MNIFYKPSDGYTADFIPFFDEGEFKLYYLHDFRKREVYGEGTPWRRIDTVDFCSYKEIGELIPRGTSAEQDLYIYTGCIIKVDDIYHIYYTGHNYHLMESNGNKEAVMHAVSKDSIHWEKIDEDTFYAPVDAHIEKNDWRDPFVFWNEDKNEYWMLLCTRILSGTPRRRGATGYLTSKDLKNWEYKGNFWQPDLCWCPECPDIFKIGEWWYLLYSTYCDVEGMRTYYRMSRALEGPWINPGNNSLDSRAFYAGKTATNGKDRYIFGWNPTKAGEIDKGEWQWGGSLVVHQLEQKDDGTLKVSLPDQLLKLFDNKYIPEFEIFTGEGVVRKDCINLSAISRFSAAKCSKMPDNCIISMNITFEKGTDGCGIMLRATDDLEHGYYLRLDSNRNRLVFDSSDRHCEHPDIERFVVIDHARTHELKIIIEGSILLAYLNNEIALSARMYDLKGLNMALFSYDGNATFTDVSVETLK